MRPSATIAQGVDVEARVGLVEHRELGLEDGHLEHLQALLLTAREALVHVAPGERIIQTQEGHLGPDERAELAHADAAPGGVRGIEVAVAALEAPAPGVQGGAQE